jgi:hypothetical protein
MTKASFLKHYREFWRLVGLNFLLCGVIALSSTFWVIFGKSSLNEKTMTALFVAANAFYFSFLPGLTGIVLMKLFRRRKGRSYRWAAFGIGTLSALLTLLLIRVSTELLVGFDLATLALAGPSFLAGIAYFVYLSPRICR